MILPTLQFEEKLWNQNISLVCGVDEVGRGCFAGPVVAGAVIFSQSCLFPVGIADSKLLKPQIREDLALKIKECALAWAIGEASVEEINQIGIGKATQLAFSRAIQNLSQLPDFILIDAFYIDSIERNKQQPIVHGDSLSTSIAAASIIAKVYRDNLMLQLEEDYPGYGFSKHKGYGTKSHQEAIKKLGLSDLHRKSFNLQKFL